MKLAPLVALITLSLCRLVPAEPESVRIVDLRGAPEAKALAARARQLGDQVYPQILDLLSDGTSGMPRRLDIVFREHVSVPQSHSGEGVTGCAIHNTAFLNAGYLCDHPEYLDAVLVHEMAHVAQNYPRMAYRHAWQFNAHWLGFEVTHPFRTYPPIGPTYWVEGIADYVCAKLGYTNALNCPQCDESYPHYTTGYSCAAALLLYIDATYGGEVVRGLNAALRRGTYSDLFFVQATGRTLAQLWGDFQKTPAYTPIAAQLNELHDALGYDNGKPPKDLNARLDKYFSLRPEIKDLFTALGGGNGGPHKDAQSFIDFILYTRHQPGGEQTLKTAKAAFKELHQALGAGNDRPPADLRPRLDAYLGAHADMKKIVADNGWLEYMPVAEIPGILENVIIARTQPGMTETIAAEEFLTRLKHQDKLPGWRNSEHGSLTLKMPGRDSETYPIGRTFESTKNGRGEIYIYTVAKDSPDGDWKLKHAWETNAKGRLLRDFSVQ